MASPSPRGDMGSRSNSIRADNKPDPNTAQHPPPLQQSSLQDLRRMVALSLMHQVEQCRLALKYAVIGWTGTLPQDKVPAALANAPSITHLNSRMDALERALTPFLPRDPDRQELDADNARRISYMRRRLLEITPGARSTRVIVPVLDEIEGDARGARLLPPEDQRGWAWSWGYDDWFRWDDGERKWVSAAERAIRVDYLL
ncbi:hypothetical protein VPNG_00446 [Cytospora leucostoma]|uniref:Uncharacterized protein n=1 Tax=Cytospora leucostoma TaxID=1230097 RepID=A0A423XPK1_9PEZI|nr:hypothetical protein VPNG_00446 [Cytospora leucostoma]